MYISGLFVEVDLPGRERATSLGYLPFFSAKPEMPSGAIGGAAVAGPRLGLVELASTTLPKNSSVA